MSDTIVWLKEYRTFALLEAQEAHYSVVKFLLNGEYVREFVENDEWEHWNEHATDFESD